MLLKLKKLNLFALLLSFLLVACGSDDSMTAEPTDDGGTTTDDSGGGTDDDPDPTGFVGELDFVLTYGGSGLDEAVDIVRAADNSYVIAGSTTSVDGDIEDKTGSDWDFWVVKVNEAGNKIWSKTYGGSENDKAASIQNTNDGGFILSGYSRSSDGDVIGNEGFHDYWILKLDVDGNIQWNKNFGFAGSDQAFEVIQTSDGGYLATGFFDVDESEGQGNDDRATRHGVGEFWLIKMDANGDWIWRRYFGGSDNDRSYDVVEDPQGGYIVTGSSESMDFDITDSRGSYDYWVVKVDEDGNKLWTRSFGGSQIDDGFASAGTLDGNFIMAGSARSSDGDVSSPKGEADVWVVKFDGNGQLIWERSYGGSSFDSARDIEPLDNGDFLVSASTRSTDGDVSSNNGENDAWMLLIGANGSLLFEFNVGGTALDFAEAGVPTDDNGFMIVGNTESNDIDIPLNKGNKDLLLYKIK